MQNRIIAVIGVATGGLAIVEVYDGQGILYELNSPQYSAV